MNVINVSQRSPEWHAWRAQGVTASEAAVVLGRSAYKTPWRLWAERTGVTAPEDLSNNPFVQRGIQFEDQARQGFEERHGTILLPLCAESSEHPVLRASLDGLSTEDEPVELKVPSDKTYQLVATQGEQSMAYQLYWVQVQAQLYVTDASRGWLVFDTCRNGSVPLDFEVKRAEGFLRDELVPACLTFWEAVQTARAPALDPSRGLYVPVESALAQWAHAASAYRSLVSERHALEDSLKQLKARMAETEAVFLGQMGDYLLAETEGIRVSRYLQNGSVDYPALLKAIAPNVDEATLNRFRRQPSERVKVTLQSQPAPAETCFYF